MRIRNTDTRRKIDLQMTPMIDIVFQLLVFFIMTFKIVALEGDFNIKMPMASPSESLPEIDPMLPMKLRLRADGNGNLASMQLGETDFGNSYQALRQHILGIVGGDTPQAEQSEAEVEIDADYDLRYDFTLRAVSAISGYTTPDGQVVKLIQKIRFAPPDKG